MILKLLFRQQPPKKINSISKLLRKSRSSFDLNFNFLGNQLGSVKELDDEEDLTIPYEPTVDQADDDKNDSKEV